MENKRYTALAYILFALGIFFLLGSIYLLISDYYLTFSSSEKMLTGNSFKIFEEALMYGLTSLIPISLIMIALAGVIRPDIMSKLPKLFLYVCSGLTTLLASYVKFTLSENNSESLNILEMIKDNAPIFVLILLLILLTCRSKCSVCKA